MLQYKSWRDAITHYEEAKDGGAGTSAGTVVNVGGQVTDAGVMPTPEALKAELELTRSALKVANAEAATRRKKLEEIEAADAKRKEAELTETQKATKRADEADANYKALQERHRQTGIRNAVRLAAVAAGFVDPNDAVALADLSLVTIDDSDKVSGATEIVAKLAKDKPHLTAQTRAAAPNINSGSGGSRQPLTVQELTQQRRPTDNMYAPF